MPLSILSTINRSAVARRFYKAPSGGGADITTGLIYYYKFDTGDVTTSKMYNYATSTNDVNVGSTTISTTTKRVGTGSLQTNNAAMTNTLLKWNSESLDKSISCWIYHTGSTGNQQWIRFDTPYLFMYLTGTNYYLAFGVDSSDVQTTQVINTTTWYHIVWTITGANNSATYKYYVNGTLTGTYTNQPNSAPTTSRTLNGIGANNGNSQPFKGYLDDLRIYNGVVLSQDQVTALYNLV